jgi:hypothetical protein
VRKVMPDFVIDRNIDLAPGVDLLAECADIVSGRLKLTRSERYKSPAFAFLKRADDTACRRVMRSYAIGVEDHPRNVRNRKTETLHRLMP